MVINIEVAVGTDDEIRIERILELIEMGQPGMASRARTEYRTDGDISLETLDYMVGAAICGADGNLSETLLTHCIWAAVRRPVSLDRILASFDRISAQLAA
jgi:hypothetical protein